MKEDVGPAPESPPAKRRQLEAVPDLWIAQWLARDALTPSQRRRVQDEKDRRKAASPDKPVGVLVGPEGVAPAQFVTLLTLVGGLRPTEIHHPGLPSRLHMQLRAMEVPVTVHGGDYKAVVKASSSVVVCPREQSPTKSAMWEMLRYAKHRRLPVKAVLPDGRIVGGS
jgi:hypothetical protein